MKYLTDIDLSQNELQNAVIQNLAYDPSVSTLTEGQMWINTSTHKLKYFDGTNIVTLGELDFEATASNIKMDGTASVGSLSTVARADHVHPSDTSRVPTTRTVNGHALSSNVTVTNLDQGQGCATCSTETGTSAKVATLSGYTLMTGGIVAVKFDNKVGTGATLNINNTGAKAMYAQGAAIIGGTIEAGDTAYFMYDGTNYNFIATDSTWREASLADSAYDNVAEMRSRLRIDGVKISTALADAQGNVYHFGTCGTERNTAAKTVSIPGFALSFGAWAAVLFTNGNSNYNPTLNVNNTGAYAIKYRGSTGVSQLSLAANTIQLMVFDGSAWQIVSDINTNTTYSVGTEEILTAGTDTTNRVWEAKILHDYIASAIGAADAMRFQGTIGTGGDVTALPTSDVKIGDTYRVITAGTYAGQTCEIGDLIIATATTPTWTVAQTNIDGAITSLSNGTGISITGSGASRTIGHTNSVTAGTAGTANATSGTNTIAIPYVKYDAQGHVTASGTHTHTIANATTLAAGLMSPTDKSTLSNLSASGAIVDSYTNPALTSSSGVCTWTLATAVESGVVTLYEVSSGQQVMADVAPVGDGEWKVKIVSASNIAAGTYKAVIIGN